MKTIVQFYRSQCPSNFDVFNGGGSMPAPPKPPAPPSMNDAAGAARRELDKRKPKGLASTILSSPLGDPTRAPVQKSLLGS